MSNIGNSQLILWNLLTLCVIVCVSINGQNNVVRKQACAGDAGGCLCALTGRPAVRCGRQGLTAVVAGIPENVVVLDLSNNNITTIYKDDFMKLERLETLFIIGSNVSIIHPEAFRNLYNLKRLVLERNKLTSIPERLFQHLPNLAEIKLNDNYIRSISRHAFVTTRSGVIVNLNKNPLQCDCELKALKDYMLAYPDKLIFNSAKCHNTRNKLEVKNTPDSEFPNCQSSVRVIPANATCYSCQNAINHEQCRQQGRIQQCQNENKVCSSRITDQAGQLMINKGCMWYSSCLNQERANVRNCGLYNEPDRQCNFCCVGVECNAGDMGGRTKEYMFIVEMTLDKQYKTELENDTSDYSKNLRKQVTVALIGVTENIEGGQTVEVLGLGKPLTTVHALLYSTNLYTYTATDVRKLLNKSLHAAAEFNGLSLQVIPSTIMVDIHTGIYCPIEIINTSFGKLQWPKTSTGRTVVIPCPNNQRSASRKCSLSSTNEGMWLQANIRDCSINSNAGNKLKKLLETPITADNVGQVLNSLKTLTSGAKGFNKEQLSLAVNVLENILKENSSFSNMGVMNGSVAVVSQLLVAQDNVLQEAEKWFKTSSKILESVDTIGNKISLNNGNIKIVQPNLVLAAVGVQNGNFSGVTIKTKSRKNNGGLSDFQVSEDRYDDIEDDHVYDNTNSYNDHVTDPPRGGRTTDNSKEHRDDDDDDDDDGNEGNDDGNDDNSNNDRDDGYRGYNKDNDDDADDVNDDDKDDRTDSFQLPRTLFNRLSAAELTTVDRVAFHVFPTSRLFSSMKEPILQDRAKKFTTKINSGVISASVPNVKLENLKDPIKMSFTHKSKNSNNASCVYWDEGTESWSSRGCSIVQFVPGSHTTCECYHLTNFALLMDVYQDGYRIGETDRKILSIISYIGCSLSFFCLVLTLLTYILFNGPTSSAETSHNSNSFGTSIRKLRKDNPSKILVNLCFALAIANLVFIVGMHDYAMNNEIGCKTVAILLHYFLLSALSWMAVEAFYMYLALVLVFKTYYSKFMLKCSIVGWGIPFIVVVVTVSISTSNYIYLDSGICWLAPIAFYGAFAGPVLLVLLINSIAFGLVLRQLCGLQAKKLTKSDRSDRISKVRGAIGVVILLGLTWIFAIFAIGPVQTVFSYLFAIFNALQGLFIFVFYCLFKKDALNSWRRLLPCCDVIDEKSSSRGGFPKNGQSKGYSGSTPATNSGNKTLSTLHGLSSKHRVRSKYEQSTDSTDGYDNSGFNGISDRANSTYI